MKQIFRLIRPQQWIKNAFVFIPMFFGGSLLNVRDITTCAITFCAFSLIASAIYCFNDVIDIEADRKHPVKCHRPIASGAVSILQAYVMMALLTAGSVVLVLSLGPNRWRVGSVRFRLTNSGRWRGYRHRSQQLVGADDLPINALSLFR